MRWLDEMPGRDAWTRCLGILYTEAAAHSVWLYTCVCEAQTAVRTSLGYSDKRHFRDSCFHLAEKTIFRNKKRSFIWLQDAFFISLTDFLIINMNRIYDFSETKLYEL